MKPPYPVTNDRYLHVGMLVATPDTDSGVVSDVRADRDGRFVYVSWGDIF